MERPDICFRINRRYDDEGKKINRKKKPMVTTRLIKGEFIPIIPRLYEKIILGDYRLFVIDIIHHWEVKVPFVEIRCFELSKKEFKDKDFPKYKVDWEGLNLPNRKEKNK